MKISLKLLIFITIVNLPRLTFSQNQDITITDNLTRSKYQNKLSSLFNDIVNHKKIETNSLLFSCPQNEQEYWIFINLQVLTIQIYTKCLL